MAHFCSSCGVQMADNAAFCPGCGKPAAATQSPATPNLNPSTAPVQASAGGIQDNIAGMLAYLLIPAIIFLVMEPYNRNKFIRFHSFQAIFMEIGWIIVNAILGTLAFLGFFLLPILWLAFTILWVVCLIKAYQNITFKLPIIGDLAEKQANS
jgi:uncharacterized membrane protein